MRRLIHVVVIPLMIALLLSGTLQTASAHEHRVVLDGKYEFVVGFRTEPAVSGEVNSMDLRVSDLSQSTPAADGGEAVGAPVEGLETTLTADIIFADQTRTLPLEPRFGQPGAYNGWVIPVQPGDYSFHIYGTINGEEIDETFTPGPETFSSVQDRALFEFPEASASTHMAPIGAVDPSATGGSDLGGGALIGVAGLLTAIGALIGVAGLLTAIGAIFVLRRHPRVQAAPSFASSAGD
jgi:hypothetical protein